LRGNCNSRLEIRNLFSWIRSYINRLLREIRKNKVEQSVLFVLCHEFIKISREFRYLPDNLKSLPVYIREMFSCPSVQLLAEFNLLAQETIYYIAGWTIHAAHKVAPRRNRDTCHSLIYFANSVAIINPTSEEKGGLSTGKVDRLIRFGGLRYATLQYFTFITRLETVFCNILSEEYIVALGPDLVDRIRVGLMGETIVTDKLVGFVPPDAKSKCFEDIVVFLYQFTLAYVEHISQ